MRNKKPSRAKMVAGDLLMASQSWLSLAISTRTKAFRSLKAFERKILVDAAADVVDRDTR